MYVNASTTSFLTKNASTNLSWRARTSLSGGAGVERTQNLPWRAARLRGGAARASGAARTSKAEMRILVCCQVEKVRIGKLRKAMMESCGYIRR